MWTLPPSILIPKAKPSKKLLSLLEEFFPPFVKIKTFVGKS